MFSRFNQNAGILFNNISGLSVVRHCSHTYAGVNNHVQKWIQTLNEIDSKKMRFYLNELRWNELNVPDSAPSPDLLTIADYTKLLQLSNNQRKQYYRYLYKIQQSEKEAKIIAQLSNSNTLVDETDDWHTTKHLRYGIGHNTILYRYGIVQTMRWQRKRLFNEMMLSPQQIIFDCGFEQEMTYVESSMTALHLSLCFQQNRAHQQPFVMNLHNLNPSGSLAMNLKKQFYQQMSGDGIFPLGIHTTDYIDHIDNDKLCAITDEATEELHEIDPEVHYVIGGIAKKGFHNTFMNNRAKELGLKTARLPFDSHLKFRYNRVIPLHQMMQILLEFRSSGDWNKAFEFIERHRLS